jgi:hypothetical protein
VSKNKKKKKDLTAGLPPLKKVEGLLPYEVDLHWDVKFAEDIDKEPGLRENRELHRILAENGYDVKEWLNDPPNYQI